MKLEYEKSKNCYQSEGGENSIFLINSDLNEEMKDVLKQHTNEKNKRKRIFQNEFTTQSKKKKKIVTPTTTQRKQRKKKDDEPKTLLETVKLILPSQMEVSSSPVTASSSNQENLEDLEFESQLEAQMEMNSKEEKPKKKRKRKIESISSDLIDSSIDAFLSSKKTKPNLPGGIQKPKKPTVPKVNQKVVQEDIEEVSKEQFEGTIAESMKRTPRTRKPTERYLESLKVKTEKDETFL
jgi:hypothetical protein